VKTILVVVVNLVFFLVISRVTLAENPTNDPQYILVRKSGSDINTCCMWNYEHPERLIVNAGIDEIRNKVFGPGASLTKPDTTNPNRRLGVEFYLPYLETNEQVEDFIIDELTSASYSKDFPVMFKLEASLPLSSKSRSDLWNFWDPNMSGYDPNNKFNVEWRNWNPSSAVQECYITWADRFYPPTLNLGSPTIIDAKKAEVTRIVGKIADWYKGLPEDKKYLLAGIDLDNELGGSLLDCDGTNPLMDPPQIGYAAATSFGIKTSGNLTISDINSITNKHASIISEAARNAGLEKGVDLFKKIYYHGAVYYPNGPTNPGVLSYENMLNISGRPGWSFYTVAGNPSQDSDFRNAVNLSNNIGWGAVEWNPLSSDANYWINALNNTLNYSNNMVVTISNWDGSDGLQISTKPEALQAIKAALEQPPCYIPASNLSPSGNITPGTYNMTWTNNFAYTSFGVRINDLTTEGFTPADDSCSSQSGSSGDICVNGVNSGQFQYTFEENKTYDYWVWTGNNCGGRDVLTKIYTLDRTQADINSDSIVDIQDYILLSNAFGTSNQNADLNQDSIVDIQDYIILSNNFGKTS